jgi:hypothetical protein
MMLSYVILAFKGCVKNCENYTEEGQTSNYEEGKIKREA